MRRFIDKVERYLIRFIVLGVVAMVVVQGVMTNDSMRFYLSWAERMEGQEVDLADAQAIDTSDQTTTSPNALITISIKDYSALPKAAVLVNGKKSASFNTNQVQLRVRAEDTLEIDSTAYNFPVEYSITDQSANLSFPRQGQAFTGNQSIVMMGKIIVK